MSEFAIYRLQLSLAKYIDEMFETASVVRAPRVPELFLAATHPDALALVPLDYQFPARRVVSGLAGRYSQRDLEWAQDRRLVGDWHVVPEPDNVQTCRYPTRCPRVFINESGEAHYTVSVFYYVTTRGEEALCHRCGFGGYGRARHVIAMVRICDWDERLWYCVSCGCSLFVSVV